MFEGLYIMQGEVPFLHPVLCVTIALGAVVGASAGRKLTQLLTPVVRALAKFIRIP